MSRSLFRRLNRRFGRSIDRREHTRRIADHRARISRYVPLDLLEPHFRARRQQPPINVAVIGGGFAGLAATDLLQNLGARVTLFEARANLGGRVESTRNFIPHRILEKGAELIGRNHPTWLHYARELELGLSVITDDDEYAGANLVPRIRLRGRVLTNSDTSRLHSLMERVLRNLTTAAGRALPGDSWRRPWDAPDGAADRDNQDLQTWFTQEVNSIVLASQIRELLQAALEFEFENDMTVPTNRQSLLAIMTAIVGGGGWLYWEDTEVFRCENGNDALVDGLVELFRRRRRQSPERFQEVTIRQPERVNRIDLIDRGVEIHSHWAVASGRPQTPTRYQYAVLAVPPSVWHNITINPGGFGVQPVQLGPAVKYLAALPRRYWISRGHAPSGVDDQLGQIWEGTDNQMGEDGIDLSVFVGGDQRTQRRAADYPSAINRLLPGFPENVSSPHIHADWPHVQDIMTGYSCPAPRQVTTIVRRMQEPIAGRIFFAGEHVSPAFFGYMEGALQSGLKAAQDIGMAAGMLRSGS